MTPTCDTSTQIPVSEKEFGTEDWKNLQGLSDKFGITWKFKTKLTERDHPMLGFCVVGNIGEHTVMYESWMGEIMSKFPINALSFQNAIYVWDRVSIEDALNIKSDSWRGFLKELMMNGYHKLVTDVAVTLQQEIIEQV